MCNRCFGMDKVYNPAQIEQKIYKEWESKKAFRGTKREGKKPFTIVMPPPNITGQLHMGHAMDALLQDAPIRYHRMKGDPTLWIPGTDHASIATEVKIVDKLASEGISKEELGREKFLEKAWEWKQEYGNRINLQQKMLGISCDWDRLRFTMDEGCTEAVNEAFVRLYNKGLIYKGNRMINWCPVCRTALSDAEVEYEEQHSHLWHIRYPAEDGGEGVIIATTRPETMLGDTAVAVNPNDERYAHLVGKYLILPLVNKRIPVVADDYVDMSFGTGAVKMTPAHDPNDLEVAKRHNLEILRINNDDGTINEHGGKYQGLSAKECRKQIVADLKEQGYLIKIEDHNHNVGTCYRCSTTVEPLISKQWFVKMDVLAAPAIDVVKSGKTEFIPSRFSKVYFNWMENIKDWCISRQLWWGHRIPAYYCTSCKHMIVAKEKPDVCPECGSVHFTQDEDVLDTWFSSALWPFSTLGWPHETEDLKYYYPTSVLVTGYDIIFFWVARMIFSGIEYMGETPFEKVLIHGLVRDAQGRKMSKSLGNGIDPIDIIDKYGADALRFSLAMGISPGNDTRYSDDKVESARNFSNKIWNASRFVLMNVDKKHTINTKHLKLADKWILHRLQDCIEDITKNMDAGEIGLATQRIYDFFWDEFCDWYIELSKNTLFEGSEEEKNNTKAVLHYVLLHALKLLHPVMLFISEEIYQHMPGTEGLIMLSQWPEAKSELEFESAARQMDEVMNIIRTLRNIRSEMNVSISKKVRLFIKAKPEWNDALKTSQKYIISLVNISEISFESINPDEKFVSNVLESCELFVPLGDLIDFAKEVERLQREEEKLLYEISLAESKLNNPGFVDKAPAQLVEKEKEKLSKYKAMLTDIRARIIETKNSIK